MNEWLTLAFQIALVGVVAGVLLMILEELTRDKR